MGCENTEITEYVCSEGSIIYEFFVFAGRYYLWWLWFEVRVPDCDVAIDVKKSKLMYQKVPISNFDRHNINEEAANCTWQHR
jgi:hypothetical protein